MILRKLHNMINPLTDKHHRTDFLITEKQQSFNKYGSGLFLIGRNKSTLDLEDPTDFKYITLSTLSVDRKLKTLKDFWNRDYTIPDGLKIIFGKYDLYLLIYDTKEFAELKNRVDSLISLISSYDSDFKVKDDSTGELKSLVSYRFTLGGFRDKYDKKYFIKIYHEQSVDSTYCFSLNLYSIEKYGSNKSKTFDSYTGSDIFLTKEEVLLFLTALQHAIDTLIYKLIKGV